MKNFQNLRRFHNFIHGVIFNTKKVSLWVKKWDFFRIEPPISENTKKYAQR